VHTLLEKNVKANSVMLGRNGKTRCTLKGYTWTPFEDMKDLAETERLLSKYCMHA
jgi:hypothetical protein